MTGAPSEAIHLVSALSRLVRDAPHLVCALRTRSRGRRGPRREQAKVPPISSSSGSPKVSRVLRCFIATPCCISLPRLFINRAQQLPLHELRAPGRRQVTPSRSLKTVSMHADDDDTPLRPEDDPMGGSPSYGRADRPLNREELRYRSSEKGHNTCLPQQDFGGGRRGRKPAPKLFRLRLIDVLNDEVVRPFHQCRYVCLSYAMGTTPSTRHLSTTSTCCEKKHNCASMGRPVILD